MAIAFERVRKVFEVNSLPPIHRGDFGMGLIIKGDHSKIILTHNIISS